MNGQTFEGILHQLRQEVDGAIKSVGQWKNSPEKNYPEGAEIQKCQREISLAYTKLQEAKMWLGKALEVIGEPLPQQYRDESMGSNLTAPASTMGPIKT